MKRSRFTEEKISGMLKELEAGPETAEACCKHGILETTIYKYKEQFGSLEISRACCP